MGPSGCLDYMVLYMSPYVSGPYYCLSNEILFDIQTDNSYSYFVSKFNKNSFFTKSEDEPLWLSIGDYF